MSRLRSAIVISSALFTAIPFASAIALVASAAVTGHIEEGVLFDSTYHRERRVGLHGAPYEWLTRQVSGAPKKDVRFLLDVGPRRSRHARRQWAEFSRRELAVSRCTGVEGLCGDVLRRARWQSRRAVVEAAVARRDRGAERKVEVDRRWVPEKVGMCIAGQGAALTPVRGEACRLTHRSTIS